MKKFYCSFVALVCAVCTALPLAGQSHVWFIDNDYSLNYLVDGTPVTSTRFSEELGYNVVFAMQASTGDLFAATDLGGAENFGSIVRVSGDGVHKIHDLTYAQSSGIFLAEGKDGFIYGVSLSAFYDYIFKFKPDGSNYQQSLIRDYGFDASELTVTSSGDIIGTTKFHLYRMKPDLSGIEILYTFSKPTGKNPIGKLVEGGDGYLYGVTETGGTRNYGTVYKIRPDGTGHTVLHEFNNYNGMFPDRGLVLDENGNLYGITFRGGDHRTGTLFTIRTDGTGFEVLHSFTPDNPSPAPGPTTSMVFDDEGDLWLSSPGFANSYLVSFDLQTRTSLWFPSLQGVKGVYYFQDATPGIRITRPSNNALLSVTDVYFILTPVPGALDYTIEIARDRDFTDRYGEATWHEPEIRSFGHFPYDEGFYARAKSSLWPGYSPTIFFKTRPAETYAFITKPANGSTDNPAPTLKVTANEVYPAAWYTIELSTSPDFSENVLVKSSEISHQRTMTFEGLAYATTYYARMKTEICDYGPVRSFTTMAEPMSSTAVANNLGVEVYPNPTTNVFNVLVPPVSTRTMRVSIMTLYGESIASFQVDGTNSIQVGHDLQKGIYLFRIDDGQQAQMIRVVKE